MLGEDPGWHEIRADTDLPFNEELAFNYRIGSSDVNPSVELKTVTSLYTDAAEKAYKLFDSATEYDETVNLASLNANPNREVEVDPLLYDAFSLLSDNDVRLHYLYPVYREYESICVSENEIYAAKRDPVLDDDAKAYFDALFDFASTDDHIALRLLDDSKVMLYVSQAYLDFASEHDIDGFIDLYWMRNAFVVDAIADSLIENGYLYGNITSYDGFARNLDTSNGYEITLFDRHDDIINPAARITYSGSASFVTFRDYPIILLDNHRYYSYPDGRTVTPYVTFEDRRSVTGIQDLTVASKTRSCAYMCIKAFPCFAKDSVDIDMLDALLRDGISSFWNENNIIFHNGDDFEVITPFVNEGNIRYTAQKH